MICYTQQLVINGTMTGTAEVDSKPFWIGTSQGFCIEAIWTGSATGTLKLQASNAATRPNTLNASVAANVPANSWADVPDSEYSVTAAGNYLWNYDGAYFPWVRAVYVNATSTGTLNITGTVKSDEVLG